MRSQTIAVATIAAVIGLTGACGGRVQSAGSGEAGGTNPGTGGASGGTGGAGGCTSNCNDPGVPGPSGSGACGLRRIASGPIWLGPADKGATEWVSMSALRSSFVLGGEKRKRSAAGGDSWLYRLSRAGVLTGGGGISTRCMNGGAAVACDLTRSSGMVAFDENACGGKGAGAVVFLVRPGMTKGALNWGSGPTPLSDSAFTPLAMSSHALAPAAHNRFAFVFTATPGHAAKLGWLHDGRFVSSSSVGDLFRGDPADSVSVTSSASILGVLAHLSSGEEALQIGAPSEGAGGTVHSLGQASWGAVAANGDRVATVTSAASGLDYRVFSASGQIAQGHFSGAAFATGDVAALGHRWIVTGITASGHVMFYRIDHALGEPVASGLVREFDAVLPGSAPSSFALAATRERVALAYSAVPGTTTSGWALFDCQL